MLRKQFVCHLAVARLSAEVAGVAGKCQDFNRTSKYRLYPHQLIEQLVVSALKAVLAKSLSKLVWPRQL